MTLIQNLKHAFLLSTVVMFTAGVTACVDEEVLTVTPETGNETVLHIFTNSASSRGDEHYGDDPYAERPEAKREESIDRIDLFFFTDQNDNGQAFYTYEVSRVNRFTTADLSLRIPDNLRSVFTDNNVYVYALVNLPSNIVVDTYANTIDLKAATMANLQEVWVNSPEFVNTVMPSNFVMRGGGGVTATGTGKDMRISGSIMIERLASKVRLWASVPERIYIDDEGNTITRNDDESQAQFEARAQREAHEIWESAPIAPSGESNMQMFFYNAATKGRIDAYIGEIGNMPDLGYADIDRESDEQLIRHLLNSTEGLNPADIDTRYPWTHSTAYYSYPNKWDSSTPTEGNQTYVIISVPWRRVTSSSTGVFENCYYQVPVNAIESNGMPADQLDPNTYYRIKLTIGMLGSKDLGSDLPVLNASYEAVPWAVQPLDVNIKDRRFLVVNQKEWVMNNTYTIEIPFCTSHKTIVEDCYVNFFRYYEPWGTDPYADENALRQSQQNNWATDAPLHNKTEFQDWLDAAELKGVKETEGEIWANINGESEPSMLYYKKKYFWDDIYQSYKYYVGHEQPKTIKKDIVDYNENMSSTAKSAWELYNTRYPEMDAVYTCKINDEKSIIEFSHPLIQWQEGSNNGEKYYYPIVRNGKLEAEYSRCEIIIKIRHEDWTKNELYHETVYITQYPGLYVEVSHNYGAPRGEQTVAGDIANAYTWINGQHYEQPDSYTAQRYPNRPYLSSFCHLENFLIANSNPNMYVIHTTHLNEEDQGSYVLGDPRTLFYNLNLYTLDPSRIPQQPTGVQPKPESIKDVQSNEGPNPGNWRGTELYVINTYNIPLANATNIVTKATNQPLSYYYPTDEAEGVGSKENFVAPVFRIASSFGKVNIGGRNEARRRCALYQEAGRPAGRWRLPTKGEIKYIARLSAEHKIPVLLGYHEDYESFAYYCSAQGIVAVNGNGVVKDAPDGYPLDQWKQYPGLCAPRCIYDDWYWSKIDGTDLPTPKGVLEDQFYWGDIPKDNTQVQSIIKKLKTKGN